ncbi:MAG: hypothetical protein J0I08_04970 [Rhizobiales bacterium]|nr:hypothetical protein [Hyphomicrobiales bacterium]
MSKFSKHLPGRAGTLRTCSPLLPIVANRQSWHKAQTAAMLLFIPIGNSGPGE